MAQRNILCIEPDTAAVSEIRNALQPYGFRIESISNGDQAMEWANVHGPQMIVLAVEPRKVGYAICNKLKRSPILADTPLLLISSEETLATFHQHKKLKSRADEYLLKPLDMNELLAIVDRLVGLSAESDAEGQGSAEEIELADDEIAEVSLDEQDAMDDHAIDDDVIENESMEIGAINGSTIDGEPGGYAPGGGMGDVLTRPNGAVPEASNSLHMLGDLSRPVSLDPNRPSPFQESAFGDAERAGLARAEKSQAPFDARQFDRDTQAAFAALESGAGEGGGKGALDRGNDPARGPQAAASPTGSAGASKDSSDLVNLSSLWDDEELPARMPWEETHPAIALNAVADSSAYVSQELTSAHESSDAAMIFGGQSQGGGTSKTSAPVFAAFGPSSAGMETTMPQMHRPGGGMGTGSDDVEGPGMELDIPMPEEVIYDDRSAADLIHKDQRIAELMARVETLEGERANGANRSVELQSRIESLENERQTLRRELDEQRDRMTQAASQGAFSKERDLLSLREVINKKEKDILDLRDALDAKERQILDHKDKIRENERARRDLEERMLGFERNLFVANERAAELIQDKDKSVERERGLKARLDDAHEELRKGQDEIEALRKRVTQEIERGRMEVEKTRIELEGKLFEAAEHHHQQLTSATDEWNAAEQAQQAAHQAELARIDAAHRVDVDGLQRRLAEESAAATDRLQMEMSKLRRDHDKTIASMKEEQALQLASERQAYEAQTEAKHRAYREEIMGLRRRHEEELAAAEDRRQRDILEQEQRRVAELEQAETRRRVELQGRDEEHHSRVTDIERRHLIEKTESAERHRLEYDQAVGRAVRAEGELIARSQEIEQAYRRLAGFEADLDAARVELGDRDLKLTQNRDRVSELEAKLSDYEDQIVRAYQRLRADEKTGEKIRRALAVALALMDERASVPQAPVLKSGASGGGGAGAGMGGVSEDAEKS